MATRATKWDDAAERVALDLESNEAIARSVGVSRSTVDKWKRDPEFQALVAERAAVQRAAIESRGVADKINRMARLDDTRRRLLEVISERASDPSMADVPGGQTGILVRQAKLVKVYAADREESADDGDEEAVSPLKQVRVVYEYAVDTGTLAELRAIEKQAAQEMGQWSERTEHTGPGGGPLLIEMVDFGKGDDDNDGAEG